MFMVICVITGSPSGLRPFLATERHLKLMENGRKTTWLESKGQIPNLSCLKLGSK